MKTKAVRRPPEKDFKKKVAKVGRKVKKSNASDIHVQSKTIYLPTQNLENNKSETVKDKLQRISKQLHHYSSPHRLAALNELSDLISLYTNTEISNGKDNDDDNASSFTNSISLILPESFELFFDEEEKIRLATVELLAKAMAKFSTATLMSVVPVAVTYVCSGLTHISKGIRADSVKALHAIAMNHPSLLRPFLDKLLQSTMALMTDTFRNVHSSSKDSAKSAINTKELTVNVGKQQSVSKLKTALFVMILKVLQSIAAIAVDGVAQDRVSSYFRKADCSHQSNVLTLTKRSLLSKWHVNNQSAMQNSNAVDSNLILLLCQKVKECADGTILEKDCLSVANIEILQQLVALLLTVGTIVKEFHTRNNTNAVLLANIVNTYNSSIRVLFEYFPYYCYEASLAIPNSDMDITGRKLAQLLNISLCELVYMNKFSSSSNSSAININIETERIGIVGSAGDFLLLVLEETKLSCSSLVLDAESKFRSSAELIDSAVFQNANDGHSTENNQTSPRRIYFESTARLFSSLSLILHNIEEGVKAENSDSSDDNSSWADRIIDRSLLVIHEIFAIVNNSHLPYQSLPKYARNTLLISVDYIAEVLQKYEHIFRSIGASDTQLSGECYDGPDGNFKLLGLIVAELLTHVFSNLTNNSFEKVELIGKSLYLANEILRKSQTDNGVVDAGAQNLSAKLLVAFKSQFYSKFAEKELLLLLDCVAYFSLNLLMDSYRDIVNSFLHRLDYSNKELRYFLQILHHRRGELGLGNYIKMLFYIITVVVHHDKEVVCANYRKMTAEDIHNNEKERQRDAIVNFFKTYGTQSNIMDDIGHYLVLLSSSESPHKIIEKMLPNLSALLVGGNSPKSKFSIVEEVPEKVLEYSRRVVVVLLSYQLLLPWRVPRVSCQRDEALSTIPIDSETIDDNFIRANSKALNGLMDLLVSTTVAILSSSYTWLESPILNDRVNPYSIIHKYIDKPIYFTKQLICALNVSKTVIEYQTKGNSQNDQDVVVYIFPSLITAMNSYGSSANCDAIVLLRFMNGLKTVTKHVSKVNYQLLLENREHLSNSLTLITDRYQNSEEKLAIEIRDSVQDFFINL